MALDPTVGGTSANSYLSRDEANTYFADRLHADKWNDASDATKDAALVTATLMIDRRVCFTGTSVSETQARRWPIEGHVTRNGYSIPSDEIPLDLKHATAELALYLLNAEDEDASQPSEVAEEGLIGIKVASVELKFKDGVESVSIPSNVLSMFPSSWLCPEESVSYSIQVYR